MATVLSNGGVILQLRGAKHWAKKQNKNLTE